MQTVSIIITIEVADPNTVQVETQQTSGEMGMPLPGRTEPVDRNLYARSLLAALKYRDVDFAMANYTPERIIDVCTSTRAHASHLANPAGYINSALRRGWNVGGNGSSRRKAAKPMAAEKTS